MAPVDRHPDAERLAEYADGTLASADRVEVERHLASCADCRTAVAETMVFAQTDQQVPETLPRVLPFRRRRWVTMAAGALAAAAIVVLAIRVAKPEWVSGLFGPGGDRPELQELIAAVAKEPTRPVEGRLTGGFKYGPPPSPTRGPGDRSVSPEVRIAAAHVESAVRSDATPRAPAELGVAYLAVHDIERAVAFLERAAAQSPADADIQNNLSVAYLARGRQLNQPQDFARARAAAEAALKVSPSLKEAAFNRALAYTYLEQGPESASAWDDFVRLDPSSEWTREAREQRLVPGAR